MSLKHIKLFNQVHISIVPSVYSHSHY